MRHCLAKQWALFGVLLASLSSPAFASKPQVKDCQRIQFRIAQLKQQQRQVSGAAKDQIKRQKRSAESEYKTKQCALVLDFLR